MHLPAAAGPWYAVAPRSLASGLVVAVCNVLCGWRQVCENIVIPNIRIRADQEEMFEMNWVEYVRRDTEGSDSDTRRRAATELVRALTERFPTQARSQTRFARLAPGAWESAWCSGRMRVCHSIEGSNSDANHRAAAGRVRTRSECFSSEAQSRQALHYPRMRVVLIS